MGFSILDKDGKAIAMGILDRDACKLWEKDVHEKRYAYPYKRRPTPNNMSLKEAIKFEAEEDMRETMSTSWYDMIGFSIHQLSGEITWLDVIHKMMGDMLVDAVISLKTVVSLEDKLYSFNEEENCMREIRLVQHYIQPYINLINLWIAKGYKPLPIK